MDCYRHPGAAAAATCIACGQPICLECREDVAGHPMCRPCVTAAEARLARGETPADPVVAEPSTPAAPPIDGAPPGLLRRIGRGMFWGVFHGQWWTLWTVISMFLWGRGSFDGEMFLEIVARFFFFGFFGSLTGLIIGAANVSVSVGTNIGVGVGVAVCLLQALMFQNVSLLINLIFYYFTGRFVGAGITGRIQQPVPARNRSSAPTAAQSGGPAPEPTHTSGT